MALYMSGLMVGEMCYNNNNNNKTAPDGGAAWR
jgi:hypothetical protein